MILAPDEERSMLTQAKELYAQAVELQRQASVLYEQVRQSQYERLGGIRHGEADEG